MEFRIKEIMKERKMKQQELADALGVSLQNIKILLNKGSLSTSTLEKIARALNVPVWHLLVAPVGSENITQAPSTIVCPKCGAPLRIVPDE